MAQEQAPAPPAAAGQAGQQGGRGRGRGRGQGQGGSGAETQGAPGAQVGAAGPAAGRGRGSVFPTHPAPDAATLERGRGLYQVNCQFCHGVDARGGDGGGPNLVRSEIVLRDQNGELIGDVVKNGRPDRGMPKFNLNDNQIKDVAAYIHNFENYRTVQKPPPSILVG